MLRTCDAFSLSASYGSEGLTVTGKVLVSGGKVRAGCGKHSTAEFTAYYSIITAAIKE